MPATRGLVVRRLLIALAVVVALLVGVNVAVTSWAQAQLAGRAQARSNAASASAGLGDFPVLYRILATGTVPRLGIQLHGVPLGPVTLSALDLSLQGVAISRHDLVEGRGVRLGDITSGTIRATVSASQLTAALGQPVRLLADGTARIEVAGHPVPVVPVVTAAGELSFRLPPGADVALRIRPRAFLPCIDAVRVGAGTLTMVCSVRHLPPALTRALARLSAAPGHAM
ncbi:MAG TPA: hypothetical protein VE152_07145 [Acidimicrobiales bacterium]|nr:hypothetical protein [Acidimicrobiales bacterium]